MGPPCAIDIRTEPARHLVEQPCEQPLQATSLPTSTGQEPHQPDNKFYHRVTQKVEPGHLLLAADMPGDTRGQQSYTSSALQRNNTFPTSCDHALVNGCRERCLDRTPFKGHGDRANERTDERYPDRRRWVSDEGTNSLSKLRNDAGGFASQKPRTALACAPIQKATPREE